MIPTIEQAIKCYRMFAKVECMKMGKPCEDSVENVCRGTLCVCKAAKIPLNSPITCLTRKNVDAALAAFMDRGVTRISAGSYIWQLKGLFSKWSLPYYQDAGWEIPPLDIPPLRAQAPRYIRPTPEMLASVKAWYKLLEGEHWFAATMMLEFAMRNGDVLRLKDENFIVRDARRYLSYTPHKTEHSSGRRVLWPIHDDIWGKIASYGGVKRFDVTEETFADITSDLRRMGFRGTKGAYELRKICIDHVYQKYGTEMAVSISGDDIRTISKYYADPAQPNIGAVRVLDLL